jgi:DNA polymerase I - 3''-5'' exonuclease and polymerase domains
LNPTSGPPCCERRNSIRGYGNLEAQVMVIGIAPGRDEVKQGRPFVGPSGALLEAVLEASNLVRDSMYFTNLCCWQNDEPDADALLTCKPRLVRELQMIKPRLIVGLGNIVANALVRKSVGKSRGYVLRYAANSDDYAPTDQFRLITYHPSAFLHGGRGLNTIYDIVRDFANVNNILTKPTDGSWGKLSGLHSVSSCDEAQRIMDNFPIGELVTVDIETTSSDGEAKDPYTDDILCICFRSSQGVFAIPREYLDKLVWNVNVRWGFHGGIFDVVGIRKAYEQTLVIAADSLYQSYAVDERACKEYQVRIHGLGPLSGEYCGTEYYKDALDRKRLAQYPIATVLNYCATDVNNTYDLINFQADQLQREQVNDFYENLLLPAANVFADIAYDGCAVDHKQMRQLQVEWYPRLYRSEVRLQKLATLAGWPNDTHGDVNTSSPKQLSRLIYDLMGFPQRNANDRSVDRDHLMDFDSEFVDLLLKQRQLEKMLNTYVEGFADDIKSDGYVHPVPLLHGTSTGRLSYQGPPIQTIPKPYRVGRDLGAFRRLFVPRNRETHTFIEADYSQLEIWVAQALSQDQQMLADLHSGDYHGRVTTECFGISKETTNPNEWGERRTQAKRVTFQRLYQGGASTLANRITGIGCSVREAQDYINRFNTRYPSYIKWCADMVDSVSEFGFIQTCFGRKRRFPVINDHSQIRQALNFPIQSIASDVCLTSLIELHALLKPYDSRPVWTVHDSILFEVSNKHFDRVADIIRMTMTEPRHPSLPALHVELTSGPNYYDQEPIKYE